MLGKKFYFLKKMGRSGDWKQSVLVWPKHSFFVCRTVYRSLRSCCLYRKRFFELSKRQKCIAHQRWTVLVHCTSVFSAGYVSAVWTSVVVDPFLCTGCSYMIVHAVQYSTPRHQINIDQLYLIRILSAIYSHSTDYSSYFAIFYRQLVKNLLLTVNNLLLNSCYCKVTNFRMVLIFVLLKKVLNLKGNSSPKSFFAYWLVSAQRRGRSNVSFTSKRKCRKQWSEDRHF